MVRNWTKKESFIVETNLNLNFKGVLLSIELHQSNETFLYVAYDVFVEKFVENDKKK